jgi:hypothetical protein
MVSIALADADPASALSFVQDKLEQFGVGTTLSQDQKLLIDRIGGRSSDLEAVSEDVLGMLCPDVPSSYVTK